LDLLHLRADSASSSSATIDFYVVTKMPLGMKQGSVTTYLEKEMIPKFCYIPDGIWGMCEIDFSTNIAPLRDWICCV